MLTAGNQNCLSGPGKRQFSSPEMGWQYLYGENSNVPMEMKESTAPFFETLQELYPVLSSGTQNESHGKDGPGIVFSPSSTREKLKAPTQVTVSKWPAGESAVPRNGTN